MNISVDKIYADDNLNRKFLTGVIIYVREIIIKSIIRSQKSVATNDVPSEFLVINSTIEEYWGIKLLLQ